MLKPQRAAKPKLANADLYATQRQLYLYQLLSPTGSPTLSFVLLRQSRPGQRLAFQLRFANRGAVKIAPK